MKMKKEEVKKEDEEEEQGLVEEEEEEKKKKKKKKKHRYPKVIHNVDDNATYFWTIFRRGRAVTGGWPTLCTATTSGLTDCGVWVV